MFQRILVAWDGSETALRGFDVAIDITRRYDAELVAVSIAYTPAHAETASDRRQTVDAAEQYLRQTFAEVADRAHRAGVDVTHEIISGQTSAARALIEYAHEHGVDLIVCGHHPTRRAGRLLLHDVAQELIDGPTPVLVVSNGTQ
jgi:nucleotide-binding universal stress UspA family protein